MFLDVDTWAGTLKGLEIFTISSPLPHISALVRELVAPAVGDDYVAAGLEDLQVARDLGAEDIWHVQRGLVDHAGRAFGLHALHDVLDRQTSKYPNLTCD